MTTIETKHLDTVIANHTQDMTGRVVAITGTTSGTGYVCARELAKLGATVLLLNRRSERSAATTPTYRRPPTPDEMSVDQRGGPDEIARWVAATRSGPLVRGVRLCALPRGDPRRRR